jgi:hypothetical protein
MRNRLYSLPPVLLSLVVNSAPSQPIGDLYSIGGRELVLSRKQEED